MEDAPAGLLQRARDLVRGEAAPRLPSGQLIYSPWLVQHQALLLRTVHLRQGDGGRTKQELRALLPLRPVLRLLQPRRGGAEVSHCGKLLVSRSRPRSPCPHLLRAARSFQTIRKPAGCPGSAQSARSPTAARKFS